VAESFSAYLDRSLPASVEQEIAAHLDQCPECRQRLESVKALVVDLKKLDGIEAGSELAWSVKRAVHRLARREASMPFVRLLPFLTSTVAAAILLIIVSLPARMGNSPAQRSVSASPEMQTAQSPRWERYVLPAQVGEDNAPVLFDQQAAAQDSAARREPSRIRGSRAVRF